MADLEHPYIQKGHEGLREGFRTSVLALEPFARRCLVAFTAIPLDTRVAPFFDFANHQKKGRVSIIKAK
jgi:hypothetical protein